jgi:murein DD-endopeptidase / murein LD-carboxypeptidase
MHRLVVFLLCWFVIGCQSTARFRAGGKVPRQQTHSQKNTNLESFVNSWLGVPYKYGGMSRNGIDCSGFSSLAYQSCFNKSIPRVSSDQYNQGTRVSNRNLQAGDLVFFSNVRYGKIDHVGIYLGDQRFAHATEVSGVTISSLTEEYYEDRYVGACRY